MIGDSEPLDSYDASDPVPVRLRILVRVAESHMDDVHRRELVRLLRVIADEMANSDG